MIWPASTVVSAPSDASAIAYDLVASAPLPSINCSLSVKRALFRGVWLARYNWFQRRTKHVVAVAFATGIGLACAFPFLDREVGVWVATASAALVVVPVTSSFFILRYDMITLLVRTYEFWFLTFILLVSHVFICLGLGDARISLIVCLVFMYQHVFVIDANTRHPGVTIAAASVGAIFITAFIVLQGFHLLKDYEDHGVIHYGQWSLTASDLVTNGSSTIVLVIMRNAFRKHRAVSNLSRESATVRCVTYRTRLKFVQVQWGSTGSATIPYPPETRTLTPSRSPASPALSQMRLVSPVKRVQAVDFFQSFASLGQARPMVQAAWTAVGTCGLFATSISVAVPSLGIAVAIGGYICTVLYCLRCFIFHNRKLIRLMMSSYDFLFLATQSYVGHGVLAYMIEWDMRWYIILSSSFCWSHWVYTLDAVTPVVRQRLGLSLRFASAVLVIQTVAHVLLYVDMLHQRRLVTQDKVLFHLGFMGASDEKFYGVPFLLNRMFTTLFWCLRLLWRLQTRTDDELLLVQGAVEYDDYDAMRRLRGANRRVQRPRRAKLRLKATLTPITR